MVLCVYYSSLQAASVLPLQPAPCTLIPSSFQLHEHVLVKLHKWKIFREFERGWDADSQCIMWNVLGTKCLLCKIVF